MKTASAAKIAAQFNEYLEVSQEQPVLVTRNGKPVAILLAVRGRDEAGRLVSRTRSLRSIFEQAHKQLEEGRAIPQDRFWRAVEQRRRARRAASGRRGK